MLLTPILLDGGDEADALADAELARMQEKL